MHKSKREKSIEQFLDSIMTQEEWENKLHKKINYFYEKYNSELELQKRDHQLAPVEHDLASEINQYKQIESRASTLQNELTTAVDLHKAADKHTEGVRSEWSSKVAKLEQKLK